MVDKLITDLNKFKIIKKIGEGNYGKVYLIQEIENPNIQYAMKVAKEEANNQEKINEFLNELKPFLTVQHPAVLPLVGFNFKSNKNKYKPTIVTKYAVNGSLDSVINKTILTPTQKYIILLGIAKGMNYLHMHGIVHRDLKPLNILLDENLYPLICDFGTAKIADLVDSNLKMSSQIGTIIFLAPERTVKDNYTYKIDVFSYAILCYILLIDKYLDIMLTNPLAFHNTICMGKRPDISLIKNQYLRSFVNKCWHDNPDDRPTFSKIVEEMSKKEFKEAMCINDEEVAKYLELYKNESFDKIEQNPVLTQIEADQGNPKQMLNFAIMNLYGNKVPKSIDLAVKYLKKAANSGSTHAMYIYGYMLYNGIEVNVDKNQASIYFKMASDRGNLTSSFIYAIMLFNGDGIEENKEEAANILKKTADDGNYDACDFYANLLYKGIYVDQNKQLACYYFKRAADHGIINSMYNYATMKFKGDGVPKDEEEAIGYYQTASEQGDEEANEKLSKVHNIKKKETANSI